MTDDKVVSLVKPPNTVAQELRAYADKLEKNEINAADAILVFRNRMNQTIGVAFFGEAQPYSNQMGMLAYAQAHLYELANTP